MKQSEALKYLKSELTFLKPETRKAIETLHPELVDIDDECKRKGLLFHLNELKDWKPGTMSPIKTPEHYEAWIELIENMKEDKDPNLDILSRFSIYKYDDDNDTIYLADVFVGEHIRGKGKGRQILKVVDEIARLFEAKYICLKVKKATSAYEWYKRNGYEYHMDDGDYVWMKKKVTKKQNKHKFWKPTKEQLDALEVSATYETCIGNRDHLLDLLSDLRVIYGD